MQNKLRTLLRSVYDSKMDPLEKCTLFQKIDEASIKHYIAESIMLDVAQKLEIFNKKQEDKQCVLKTELDD